MGRPTAQYDSWLAIGNTDGSSATAITEIGFDFSAWDEAHGVHVTDGSLEWTNAADPAMQPAGVESNVVIAQITVLSGTSFVARVNVEGYTVTGLNAPGASQARYEEFDVRFTI